jgi:hypothetical protein
MYTPQQRTYMYTKGEISIAVYLSTLIASFLVVPEPLIELIVCITPLP